MFNNDIIMTDIIIINRNVFLERKHNVINSITRSKYDDIYKTYQCFSANLVIAPLIIKYHEDNRVYKNKPKRNDRRDDNTYFNNRKKDLHRTILGIFNVLNHDNYNKMLAKVRLLKTDVNISFIINDLLDKCTIQVFYLNVYIKFLHDIEELCSPQERLLVITCFNTFIKNHIDSREWINGKIIESCSDYNAFCDSQKKKNIIQAKNIIICHLLNLYDDLEFTIDNYIVMLVDDLKHLCFSVEKVDNDDCNIVLIVQMLIDIIKTYKNYNNQIELSNLIDSLEDIKDTITSKKLKFMIEDLAKLIQLK